MSDCVTLAIKQNTDVIAAAKRVEAASAAVTQAKSSIYPSLVSSGYFQKREQSLASQGNLAVDTRTNDYNLDVRVSQNLYSSGAVRARIAAAKLQEKSAALDYQAQLETTILLVRSAFYQTLYAEGSIGVRQEALDLLQAQLKDQRDRLAAGSVSQINVNRAQVALANEEPAFNDARYTLRAAYVTLAQALAVPYPDGALAAPFHVRGELVNRPVKYSLDECLRRAENQRPEIAARQLDIEALNRQLTVDKSTTRPRLDAFAAYDVYSETSTLAQDDYFKGYTIGLNASWQIFDGFATLGRVRSTRARIGGAAASLTAVRQQVQADVRTAYYQFQEAEATLRPEADNIRLANETLQVTQNNFNAGLAAQLDVLATPRGFDPRAIHRTFWASCLQRRPGPPGSRHRRGPASRPASAGAHRETRPAPQRGTRQMMKPFPAQWARRSLRSTAFFPGVAIGACLLALVCAPRSLHAENLTLEQCLRETALHNPLIVVQARNIKAAAGTALTLRSRALPTFAIGGILGQQGAESDAKLLEPAGRNAAGQEVNVLVVQKRPSQFIAIGTEALYQPLFDAAIPATWRRATLETATAQENYYAAAVTQLYATRTLFYVALFQRENGVILADIDRSFASNIKTVEGMVNAGLSSRQALLQAQTQRAGFASLITATTGAYRTTLTALLAAMGREQSAVGGGDLVANVHLEGELDDKPITFDSRLAARQALASRSDLLALRLLIRSFREDARITRAGYYPLVRVYVTGELIPQSFVRSDRPNALRSGDQVQTSEIRPGGQYSWNVIDTGLVSGTAQLIDRTREQLEASLVRLEQDIPRNLARLRAQLDDAAATIKATTENLTAAQDTLNIVTASVAQGTDSQLDFENAETGLLSTRSSLLQARFQASIARAEFDSVAGGYLRFVPAAEPARSSSKARMEK